MLAARWVLLGDFFFPVLLFLVSPSDHGFAFVLVPEEDQGFTDAFSPLKNLCLY